MSKVDEHVKEIMCLWPDMTAVARKFSEIVMNLKTYEAIILRDKLRDEIETKRESSENEIL